MAKGGLGPQQLASCLHHQRQQRDLHRGNSQRWVPAKSTPLYSAAQAPEASSDNPQREVQQVSVPGSRVSPNSILRSRLEVQSPQRKPRNY